MSGAENPALTEERACGTCGGTTGYVVTEVVSPHYEYSNSIKPLSLTAAMVEGTGSGFFSKPEVRTLAKLAARVCGGCGRVELFAQDLAILERFAAEGLGGVTRF